MRDRILLFIPCYNCAPQIGRVLGQLRNVDPAVFDEVLVLDNRSTDDTVERASRGAAALSGHRVTIARNRQNYSLGGSHKAAFAHAIRNGLSHVIVLHGDDQARLADLLPLIEAGGHRQHDALLGARFARGAQLDGYSLTRILGNRAFNLLLSMISGARVSDLGSGLNLFGRAVFEDPAVLRAADDLRFNIYLLLRMIDAGRIVRFFPISWREEDQVSNVRLASQSFRTLAIAWNYCTNRRGFQEQDHRDCRVDDYDFDVIARFGADSAA
jgi:dolichol-phosphate mannosyltransferase